MNSYIAKDGFTVYLSTCAHVLLDGPTVFAFDGVCGVPKTGSFMILQRKRLAYLVEIVGKE